MTAWRLFKAKHRRTALTGEGARVNGGRWNSPGTAVVYASGSPALAALEALVHLEANQLLNAYLLAEVTFDSVHVEEVDLASLPRKWRASPAPAALRRIGDDCAASRSTVVLRVPSAVVDGESNYLLNPLHPVFPQVIFGSPRRFRFDSRLIKRGS